MRFSKRLLVSMFTFLFCFIVGVFILYWHTGSEPSTLIGCVFGFCGLEGGAMAWIRTTEDKNRKDEKNE